MNKKTFVAVVVGMVSFIINPLMVLAADVLYTPSTALPLVSIGTNGATTIRGTLNATTTSNFVLSSWGKNYTVTFAGLTKSQIKVDDSSLNGTDVVTILSKFRIGDMIGLTGTMGLGGVVASNYIHNWTVNKAAVAETLILDGTVVPGSFGETKLEFKLKLPGVTGLTYNISTCTGSEIPTCAITSYLNYERGEITQSVMKSQIKAGDHVRAQVSVLTGSIDAFASAVRDLCITGNLHQTKIEGTSVVSACLH